MGTNLPTTPLVSALRDLGFTTDPHFDNAMVSPGGCVWVTLDEHPDGVRRSVQVYVFRQPSGFLRWELSLKDAPVRVIAAMVEQALTDGLVHS